MSSWRQLLIGVILIITERSPGISAPRCDYGAMRLVDGSNKMEGKVQVCLVNTWNAVCGRLSPQEQNVLCREMGYLRNQSSSMLGRNAFGEVRCRGQRYMNIIACDGVEERLLECSYHLQIVNSMNCCGTNPAVVKCMEGVPPTNVTLSPDGIAMRVNWGPPNQSQELHLMGYTITCSTIPDHWHLIQVEVSEDAQTTAITGLQLADHEYECCVAADYQNYHPRVCENTMKLIPTTGPSTEIKDMEHHTTLEQPSQTVRSIATTSPVAVTASPNPQAMAVSPSVVGGVMGAVIVLLLAMLCGSIVYHTKVKVKGRVLTRNRHRHQDIEETAGGKELDSLSYQRSNSESHIYERVDWSRRNSSVTNKTLLCNKGQSLNYYGDRQLKDLKLLTRDHYEYADIPEMVSGTLQNLPETKSEKDKGPQHPAVLSPYAAALHEQHVVEDESAVVSSALREKQAVIPQEQNEQNEQNGQYEFMEVQQSEENSSGLSSDPKKKAQNLSDHYEFAQISERQVTPPEFDIYSSAENLPTAGNDGHNPTSRKAYYNICAPDLETPDAQTDHNEAKSNVKPYINVHLTDEDSTYDAGVKVHHGYSHLELLDSGVDCRNSYSHIHLGAETDSNHTHSHSELNSNASHSYSHINTMEGELVSSGYLHLDTNSPMASTGGSPASIGRGSVAGGKRGSVQALSPSGSSTIATTKSYSQLDVSRIKTLQVPDTLGSTGGSKGPSREPPAPPVSRSVPRLDVKGSGQEVSMGYSRIEIGENQAPMGYSQLDITEIQGRSEAFRDNSHVSKGYSHLDIAEIQGSSKESRDHVPCDNKGYSRLDIEQMDNEA